MPCGIQALDDFLEGGLPRGALVEWGAPLGRGGRELLLPWLARASQEDPAQWILWVSARPTLEAYPPAWQARGLRLERIRFAVTPQPVADLRPVFLEPFFRIVVLDAPALLTKDDCAFLARRARAQGQTVVLVRDALLDSRRGNVWARLRLNAWHEPTARRYRLRVIRGLSPRTLSVEESALDPRPSDPLADPRVGDPR